MRCAVDDERVLGYFHRAGEAAVVAVVLQEMGVGLGIRQVVDRHDLDVFA